MAQQPTGYGHLAPTNSPAALAMPARPRPAPGIGAIARPALVLGPIRAQDDHVKVEETSPIRLTAPAIAEAAERGDTGAASIPS
jgi:hypothetical protein